MNIQDYIVLALVLTLAAGAIYYIYRRKKAGKGCCGNCGSCGGCSNKK